MKAFVLKKQGIKDWGEFRDVDLPKLDPNKIRVKVKASSINPIDYKITQSDKFKVDVPKIMGCDFAGDIHEIGENVSMFSPGQRVAGLASINENGSFAEFVDVDPLILFIIPDGVSYPEAAVVPCAGISAWQAVIEKVVTPYDNFIFITSGSGGVGGFAIQFASKILCAKPITTASESYERLYKLGAEHIINYRKENVSQRIDEITCGEGVKTVIDMISPESALENSKLLCFNGSVVTLVGQMPTFPCAPFTKAITVAEVALVAPLLYKDKTAMISIAKSGEKILQMIKDKVIDPMLTLTYSFDDLPRAFEKMESRTAHGKIAIVMN